MVDRERNHWKLTSFAPPFLCRVRFGRGSFFELILLRLLSLLRRCCWSAVLALCLVPLWSHSAATPLRDGQAEQRLMQVLALTSAGLTQQALPLAEDLVRDYPNFQLAQLALGDLLLAQTGQLATLGSTTAPTSEARDTLNALRVESLRRLAAQKQGLVPPPGTVPAQLLQLPKSYRHAIAIDAALSRLYLLENGPQGLRIVADYYASVGKMGIDKTTEGDQRTPLGVYFITSNLDPKTLDKFYGAGALPLNYPNPLDVRRGKTGRGIWLHGTPPEQFSRAPQATDGCVALANPDLERLLRTVQTRTTAVVIAPSLTWVPADDLAPLRDSFVATLAAWQEAKSGNDLSALLSFYTDDFQGLKKITRQAWSQQLAADMAKQKGRPLVLKELSLMHWQDEEDTMVVTFGAVPQGERSGSTLRQYWRFAKGQGWKIFFEGNI